MMRKSRAEDTNPNERAGITICQRLRHGASKNGV